MMPLEIPDRFIDVDFQNDPAFVPGDLTPEGFLAFENGDKQFFGSQFRAYEDVHGVMSDEEIRIAIGAIDEAGGGMDKLVTRIFDQGREGSCVGNAGTQAHQIIQAVQYGKENVTQLSAVSLYDLIGRSPSSGAMVDDCLEAGTDTGILPLDTPENRAKYGEFCLKHTGFRQKREMGWEPVAKRFRFHESLVLRSVEGLLSAQVREHPVVVGRAGHSIVYVRPMLKSGAIINKYANSWKESWGDGGFGYDSKSMIASSSRWAFAVCSIVVPN